jgi:hypothetical protein
MRQRLGLAGALLKDPALLVLDEPVNGLDPAGIREIRELLRTLGAEGRTVFLSSHLLSEVEQTCDRVAIIDRGRLVLSGRVEDVLAEAARPSLVVGVDDTVAAADVLQRGGLEVDRAGPFLRVALPSCWLTPACTCMSCGPTLSLSRTCSSASPDGTATRRSRHDVEHRPPDSCRDAPGLASAAGALDDRPCRITVGPGRRDRLPDQPRSGGAGS